MRKLIKVLSLMLCSCCTSILFYSCDSDDKKSAMINNEKYKIYSVTDKNHFAKIVKKDDYIVKSGKAIYTIVVPKEAERYELKAAELIVEYYQKALGVTLNVITDDTATNKEKKYISIGDTLFLQNSGISIPEEKYGSSGFRILTQDSIIYIAGARTIMRRGTYYGAQEFLKYTIDWEAYTPTDIYYSKMDTVEMLDFDLVEIPDFDFRRAGYQTTYNDNEYSLLMRMTPRREEDELNLTGHSHFEIISPSIYYEEHPEWFYLSRPLDSEDFSWVSDAQLCLTNEDMIGEFVKNVTQLFIENPKVEFIHLGQTDNQTFCQCDSCKSWIQNRGTNESGLMVNFTNRIAREVTDNIHKIDPNRKLTFEFFAYLKTINPPTNKVVDSKGNISYVAHHRDVIPDDNVVVQFTPLLSQNTATLDHENNKYYYECFQGWSAISNNISVWKYAINFNNYMINLKNWDVVGDDLSIYKNGGVRRMYEQGPLFQTVLQMNEMRIWIYGKLMWNTSLNWDDLAQQFISKFYGPAAEYVQEYYNYMTTYCAKIFEIDGYTGTCFFMLTDERYWSFSFVEGGRQIFERAYKGIEKYKDNDDYGKYYWRLTGVYFENMFMQLEFHMSKYSVSQNRETLAFFKKTREILAITKYGESAGLTYSTYETKWEGTLNAF